MASESTETQTVTVSLPAELDDWLDDHAAALDVDRSTLLVQLLSTYRATAEPDEFDADGDVTVRTVDEDALATSVDDAVTDRLDAELEERLTSILADELDERVAQQVDAQVADRVSEETETLRTQLGDRIDSLENEYREALQDVRERVVQVKRDTDAKAPADHTHEQLDRVADLEAAVSALEADLETLREEYEETVTEHGQRVDTLETQFDTVRDRLQTVAWAVSDLREAQESGGLEVLDRIKRAAAKADIDRAKCGNCGDGVQLSLLTDPECPHCNATVTNVEPGGGWFASPKLVAASQLESGEDG